MYQQLLCVSYAQVSDYGYSYTTASQERRNVVIADVINLDNSNCKYNSVQTLLSSTHKATQGIILKLL